MIHDTDWMIYSLSIVTILLFVSSIMEMLKHACLCPIPVRSWGVSSQVEQLSNHGQTATFQSIESILQSSKINVMFETY